MIGAPRRLLDLGCARAFMHTSIDPAPAPISSKHAASSGHAAARPGHGSATMRATAGAAQQPRHRDAPRASRRSASPASRRARRTAARRRVAPAESARPPLHAAARGRPRPEPGPVGEEQQRDAGRGRVSPAGATETGVSRPGSQSGAKPGFTKRWSFGSPRWRRGRRRRVRSRSASSWPAAISRRPAFGIAATPS